MNCAPPEIAAIGLHRQIPALREFEREFCGFGADSAILSFIEWANSRAYSKIPGATVREFFRLVAGILDRAAGIFKDAV
jgi:hypothetical protein